MLRWALFVWLSQEIERLNFGSKDSRVLRLLHRELAAAEDVAAALLKEKSAVVNLVPQTRHGQDSSHKATLSKIEMTAASVRKSRLRLLGPPP
jgi:hypothetical protein